MLGIAAGTLGLESYAGFVFYVVGALLVTLLLWAVSAKGQPEKYFYTPSWDLLGLSHVFGTGGLMGFVTAWTLFYGIVRI